MAVEPPTSLSPSRMGEFLKCPMAYWFHRIARVPEAPKKHLILGTTVHSILEELMTLKPVDRDLFNVDIITDRWLDTVKLTDEYLALDDVSDFDAKIRRCVTRIFDLIDPAAIRPAGIEIHLEADLDGWTLRGIIDLLELRDGALIVRDYKTGRVPSERYQRSAMDGIHFYALLIRDVFGVLPAEVDLLYLDGRQRIAVTPTERSVRAMRGKARAVKVAIERACETERFGCNVSKLCDWCDFKSWCPAHGGNPDEAPRRSEEPSSTLT